MRNTKEIFILLLTTAMLAIGCGPEKAADAPKKVEKVLDMELYVMSQCPYGVQAMDGIIPAVEKFGGQVGLTIEYIGQKKPDGSLSSMHGEKEVQGNIDQLCARDQGDNAKYLKFLTCVNKDWRNIPTNTDACAKEAGLDAAKLKECKDGAKGKELLSASFDKATAKQATGSPTIFLNGAPYGGNRTQQAVEQTICSQFGKDKKLDYCANMAPPAEVKLVVITDKRCGAKCDPARMIQSLQGIFMGLKPEVKDWSDPGTQDLAKAAGVTMLPALFFDKSVEKDEGGFKHMERWLTKTGDFYIVKVKAVFDPNSEICDNKVDDTGDGKVDCEDAACANSLACRPDMPKTLEVFVMSQCPFGAMAVNAMGEVLDAFKTDMNFQVHFIADMAGDQINSMHGPAEVEEDIRWACAAKKYPKNNDYLKYVWCRAADYRNPDWKKCATGPIKADVIEKCATGEEGKALLAEDIKIAKSLDISASPTWVVNGKTKFSGVTPKAIQDNFCQANPGLKGCEKPLSDERKSDAPAGSCGG